MAGPQPNGNGNGIQAPPGALYANANAGAMNGNHMPSAGHSADMQTLMQSMEALSGWLQQNREELGALQEGLYRVERAGALHADTNGTVNELREVMGALANNAEAHMVNGELETTSAAESQSDSRPTVLSLQRDLAASHSRIHTLETTLSHHEKLQTLYESTLTETTSRLRTYIADQTNYITSIHSHYGQLLTQSREELVEAQIRHQGWQEGLGRLSKSLRGLAGEWESDRRPWVGVGAGLKEENRVLRRLAGWEPIQYDEDEDEDDDSGLAERKIGLGLRNRGEGQETQGVGGGGVGADGRGAA
ncbi:hypothetical protein LTR62_001555 [Meristemomyces frigidus]|uniref:Uncharacterized protein n=1 Tax=Meristemomyces frigidus TaxID=1508187 RepID=A0AAN7TST0_9PEZI|nr:hypothetical protein LTR62_001555 [Meristemomyces frigidus]